MAGIQGLGERGTNVRSDPSPHIQYVDVIVGLLIHFFFLLVYLLGCLSQPCMMLGICHTE